MKHCLAGLIGLLLAGCSLGFVLDGSSQAPVAPSPDPDYKQLVADNIPLQFFGRPQPAAMQISALRPTAPLQQGDWMACLKGVDKGQDVVYGVFLRNYEVVNFRLAVMIDHCENQVYGPLPPPTPLKEPAAKPR
jgi:hypothetical protein